MKRILLAFTFFSLYTMSMLYGCTTDTPDNIEEPEPTPENWDLKDFPQGADPREVGVRLAERYIRTVDTQAPRVNYPYVCTWLGAFRFAQTIQEDDLYGRLLERYDRTCCRCQTMWITTYSGQFPWKYIKRRRKINTSVWDSGMPIHNGNYHSIRKNRKKIGMNRVIHGKRVSGLTICL